MGNVFFNIFPNENFIDLGMFQCGREACTPCHSFGPVTRNHYLFHYVLSGTGTLMADDAKGITQTYSVRSGQDFLFSLNRLQPIMQTNILPGNIHGLNLMV